jgi:hypothetical protein
MKNSKKAFSIGFVVFMAIVAIVAIDMGRKTTFPGSKPALKERILNKEELKQEQDSVAVDNMIEEEPDNGQE